MAKILFGSSWKDSTITSTCIVILVVSAVDIVVFAKKFQPFISIIVEVTNILAKTTISTTEITRITIEVDFIVDLSMNFQTKFQSSKLTIVEITAI